MGRLALVDRRILFEFDPSFLADPLPLSPAQLPVRPGVHEEAKHTFDGLFGVFDDSLPDGWGRLLLDREMARRGFGRRSLTVLDRLAFVGSEGAGALTYRPAWKEARPTVVELGALAAEARQVLDGDAISVFPALLAAGSSGGARPKVALWLRPENGAVSVGMPRPGYVPALVKFANRGDPVDVGAMEAAYMAMARRAGIHTSRTWLVGAGRSGPGWFATERFDREPRIHVHTACGLLHADHRVPSLDYEDLLKTVRWLTRDQRDVDQMFRRMVFNVLAHNRDDHSRNFAFQMSDKGAWRLAPAYDLTFSSGPGGEHWMTVAGQGKDPGAPEMQVLAERVGVLNATRIVDEVRAAVASWPAVAAEVGLTKATTRRVAAVIGR